MFGRGFVSPATNRRRETGAEPGTKVGARCHLETAKVKSASYLVLIGEFDLSCADRFKTSLAKALADGAEHLVLDLRSVTFIDSTGLAMVLKADSAAREAGAQLYVARSPTAIVAAVFEAGGLDKLLPLMDEPPQLGG
jgi:anti-sigma B factor antagonist